MKELEDVMEFTHFACTSEDINNLSHALQLQQCVQTELLATMDKVRGNWASNPDRKAVQRGTCVVQRSFRVQHTLQQ
jgi:adenylosuccinate lyase